MIKWWEHRLNLEYVYLLKHSTKFCLFFYKCMCIVFSLHDFGIENGFQQDSCSDSELLEFQILEYSKHCSSSTRVPGTREKIFLTKEYTDPNMVLTNFYNSGIGKF